MPGSSPVQQPEKIMECKDLEPNLTLYLYDEMSAAERAASEAHLAACARCRGLLDETRRLQQLLNQRTAIEPTPDLLVRCRLKLDEALEREQLGWRSLFREWLPGMGMGRPSGALAALTLVLFGFGLGWMLRPQAARVALPPERGLTTSSATDLGDARISGISQVSPDPQTGAVRITLNAEHRVTMEGSLDDARIRQVLVYALKSYSNPGIRLDTLEALRARSDDPSVQPALLSALRHDPNLGVRLDALRAVRKMDWNPEVREALLDVLRNDKNPGLRGAVVDELVKHAAKDPALVPVLENLAEHDTDQYVHTTALRTLVALGANNN